MRERHRTDREQQGASWRPVARDIQDAVREGTCPTSRNHDPQHLAAELRECEAAGFRPMRPQQRAELMHLGEQEPLKWVITKEGDLLFGPQRFTHASLAAGEDVAAAGQVQLIAVGTRAMILELTNYSGHYQPGPETLEVAVRLFRAHGFLVPPQAVLPIDARHFSSRSSS